MKEYDRAIQEYIDTVCKQIKWKNYHFAIGTELKNHIVDNTEDLNTQGISKTDALKQTLSDMGDPKVLGEQLNAVYQPKYNRLFILCVFCASVVILIMNCFVCKEFSQDAINIINPVIYIGCGIFGGIFVCCCDFSKLFIKKKIIIGVPAILMIICMELSKGVMHNAYHFINGVLIFIPFFLCLFIGLLKDKKELGIILSFVTAILSVILCSFSSYAAAFLVGVNGWFIIIYFVHQNWFGELGKVRKTICEIMCSLPFIIGIIYIVNRKLDNILLNRQSFFAKEYIKNAAIIGIGENTEKYGSQFEDYPLLFFILYYGYIFLILYIAVLAYIFYEIFRVYKNQQTIIGRAIILYLLISYTITTIFSVLLNLGIPLIKGFAVPLLGFHFENMVLFLSIGLLEAVDCFGNYMFIKDAVNQNHLFEIEDGKVIFYYK